MSHPRRWVSWVKHESPLLSLEQPASAALPLPRDPQPTTRHQAATAHQSHTQHDLETLGLEWRSRCSLNTRPLDPRQGKGTLFSSADMALCARGCAEASPAWKPAGFRAFRLTPGPLAGREGTGSPGQQGFLVRDCFLCTAASG